MRGVLAGEHPPFLLVLLSVTLAMAGWMVRSVHRRVSSRTEPRWVTLGDGRLVPRQDGAAGVSDPEARILDELYRTADQLRDTAEELMEDLSAAPPLQGVLRQELDLVGQRLAELWRADGGPVTPRQLRQRLQGAVRELHRLIKIAEGAAASFAVTDARPGRLPTSREEAYQLLGVNDSVSDATLKKIVDALRMSWHPDHARDEVDRQRREERIKQINVAWDLIMGRRLTA